MRSGAAERKFDRRHSLHTPLALSSTRWGEKMCSLAAPSWTGFGATRRSAGSSVRWHASPRTRAEEDRHEFWDILEFWACVLRLDTLSSLFADPLGHTLTTTDTHFPL
jgi:anti-sigma-K factor RskA